MARRNHSPERTCLGCLKHDAKAAMIRIVVRDGYATVDTRAGLPGRGGYLHSAAGCLKKFARSKHKRFRSLGASVSAPDRLRIAEEIGGPLDSRENLE